MRAQDQLQLGVDPSQGAELEKVDLEVSVGVYTLHDPLDLGLAVRKSLSAHEFGEAGLAHAALALVFQVYMSVKLSTEARVVEAAEHQHQRVRNLAERNLCGTLGVELQHRALRVFCKLLAVPNNGKRLAHHDLIAHAPSEAAVDAKVAVVGDRAQHAHVRLRLAFFAAAPRARHGDAVLFPLHLGTPAAALEHERPLL